MTNKNFIVVFMLFPFSVIIEHGVCVGFVVTVPLDVIVEYIYGFLDDGFHVRDVFEEDFVGLVVEQAEFVVVFVYIQAVLVCQSVEVLFGCFQFHDVFLSVYGLLFLFGWFIVLIGSSRR